MQYNIVAHKHTRRLKRERETNGVTSEIVSLNGYINGNRILSKTEDAHITNDRCMLPNEDYRSSFHPVSISFLLCCSLALPDRNWNTLYVWRTFAVSNILDIDRQDIHITHSPINRNLRKISALHSTVYSK